MACIPQKLHFIYPYGIPDTRMVLLLTPWAYKQNHYECMVWVKNTLVDSVFSLWLEAYSRSVDVDVIRIRNSSRGRRTIVGIKSFDAEVTKADDGRAKLDIMAAHSTDHEMRDIIGWNGMVCLFVTVADIDAVPLMGNAYLPKSMFDQSKKERVIRDLLAPSVLLQEGGIYLDNIICSNPEPLPAHIEAVSGLLLASQQVPYPLLTNKVIAAPAGSRMLRRLHKAFEDAYHKQLRVASQGFATRNQSEFAMRPVQMRQRIKNFLSRSKKPAAVTPPWATPEFAFLPDDSVVIAAMLREDAYGSVGSEIDDFEILGDSSEELSHSLMQYGFNEVTGYDFSVEISKGFDDGAFRFGEVKLPKTDTPQEMWTMLER